jgi:hypothetical protein
MRWVAQKRQSMRIKRTSPTSPSPSLRDGSPPSPPQWGGEGKFAHHAFGSDISTMRAQ